MLEPLAVLGSLAPWPLLLAAVALLGAWALFRRRTDVFAEVGFGEREVLLLALGPVVGVTLNVPLAPVGGTWIALNLGGGLLPILIAGLWIARSRESGRLRVVGVTALAGTVLVALVAHHVARFDPAIGVFAEFPAFFFPPVVAAAFALAVSIRDLPRSLPVAYASGSLGALVGADLANAGAILDHYALWPEPGVVSIGGAGAFDMVPLTGTLAMLACAVLVGLARARPVAVFARVDAGADDRRRALAALARSPASAATQRAMAALDRSEAHLWRGEWDRSREAARAAVADALSTRSPDSMSPTLFRRAREILGLSGLRSTRATALEAHAAARDVVAELAGLPRASVRPPPPRTASAALRLAAFLVDALVLLGVVGALAIALLFRVLLPALPDAPAFARASVFVLLVALPLALAYFTLFEYAWAATPGKRLFGLRVATVEGRMPSLLACFVRNLFRLPWVPAALHAMLLPLGVFLLDGAALTGYVVLAADAWLLSRTELDQRLGDVVADTVVVQDR